MEATGDTSQTASSGGDDKDDNWHVEAVLGPEYFAPVRTVDALVDVIVDRRHTSRLVQDLSRLSPIPSLRHLKRVCPDGRIIIQLADDLPKNECSRHQVPLSENGPSTIVESEFASLECGSNSSQKKRSFFEALVDCASALHSASKINEQPLTVSDEQISCTKNSTLSEEQCMVRPSGEGSESGPGPGLPAGLNAAGLRGHPQRTPVPATAPLTRAQFAEAQRFWSCNFHPSRGVEAALAPGAGIAAAERRPLLRALRSCHRAAAREARTKAAAAVNPRDGSLVALAVDARNVHPLQHAAMRLVDLVARTQKGGVWSPLPGEEHVDSNVLDRGSSSDSSGRDSLPYLCTGLDIVLTHEPCAMCAMALTHARAHRVFFSEDNPQGGVLYSLSPPLHTLPGLNHRLRVFRAPLPRGSSI